MSYNNCNSEPRRGFTIADNRDCGCRCSDDRGDFYCGGDSDLVLAIAHVPMQYWRRLFSQERAFRAGTLFEELELPFLGGKRR